MVLQEMNSINKFYFEIYLFYFYLMLISLIELRTTTYYESDLYACQPCGKYSLFTKLIGYLKCHNLEKMAVRIEYILQPLYNFCNHPKLVKSLFISQSQYAAILLLYLVIFMERLFCIIQSCIFPD
jgi:hypothetical protein